MALQDTAAPRALPGRRSALVVGAATRDLVADDPRGWRLGGAVSYAALTLARLGLRVRALVGVDAAAASAPELDLLRAAGAELRLVRLEHGPVFMNDERLGGRIQTALEIADPLPVAALPVEWQAADAVFLGPVADELGAEWAGVDARAVVALGWQGLLRVVARGTRVEPRAPATSALLDRADLVGLSTADVDPALPIGELERHLRLGATLVLTDGERGGLLGAPARPSGPRRWRAYSAISANAVTDPTGAGDVFLATLLASHVDGSRLWGPAGDLGVWLAAAAGSLCVEAPGLFGVPDLSSVVRRAARHRIA